VLIVWPVQRRSLGGWKGGYFTTEDAEPYFDEDALYGGARAVCGFGVRWNFPRHRWSCTGSPLCRLRLRIIGVKCLPGITVRTCFVNRSKMIWSPAESWTLSCGFSCSNTGQDARA
jgi:hypothetical protein